MDPICIGTICFELSLEVGALILGAVGAAATLVHHLHLRAHHEQRERHHQEMHDLHERLSQAPLPPPRG